MTVAESKARVEADRLRSDRARLEKMLRTLVEAHEGLVAACQKPISDKAASIALNEYSELLHRSWPEARKVLDEVGR